MVQRYHLELAVIALACGALVAAVELYLPRTSNRTVAIAAALGALLGSWGNPRGVLWVIVAALVVVSADDPEQPHPLGRHTVALTVVALVGIWAAVPDTEPPLAAIGALLPISVLQGVKGQIPGPGATAALVVAVAGAVWVGSAGWGAALATVGAIGLIASAPIIIGFNRAFHGRRLVVLLMFQGLVGLLMPRWVMSRPVGMAVVVVVAINLGLAALAWGWGRGDSLRVR
ncbi:MAG: hypothetical protein M9922_07235 [Microthrixaceae bacterium]|nr:hypothetical protein [Microthrixaceae bacterium]